MSRSPFILRPILAHNKSSPAENLLRRLRILAHCDFAADRIPTAAVRTQTDRVRVAVRIDVAVLPKAWRGAPEARGHAASARAADAIVAKGVASTTV